MRAVAIIGGGVAALAAAHVFGRSRIPFVLIEREGRLGGRLATLEGGGWRADVGCPYFERSDRTLMALVREVGLDHETVTLQDAILDLDESGAIGARPTSFAGGRVTLRGGMASLGEAWRHRLAPMLSKRVGALRWVEEETSFRLRDHDLPNSIRHPISNDRLEATGVLLATGGLEALRIAEGSGVLGPLAPMLRGLQYAPSFVGVFRTPRIDPGFYALRGSPAGAIEWLAFEERKAPGRAPEGESLIVARAGEKLSKTLAIIDEAQALERLWQDCRRIVKDLAEKPAEAHAHRWFAAQFTGREPMRLPEAGVPTDPPGLPVALAGDYMGGNRAELAAASGVAAAQALARRL